MAEKFTEVLKTAYFKGYSGCSNCEYQPGPLQVCEWLKRQNKIVVICPRWKLRSKGEKDEN